MWISTALIVAICSLIAVYQKAIASFCQRFYYAWKLVKQGDLAQGSVKASGQASVQASGQPPASANQSLNQDQLHILSDVYDQVRDHLMNSQKELEILNQNLEEKVRLRTKELEELSIRDPLTGLYNRRHFDERLKEEFSRSIRHKLHLSIVYIDLDNFKNYNDVNGHPTGDALLEQFSSSLSKILRTSSIACRIGGEEFCVILPHTDIHGAKVVAEKIRVLTETTEFPNGEKQPLGRVTCSLGISEYPGAADNVDKLILSADTALYWAKKNGRNQVASALDPQISKTVQAS